MSQAGRDWSQFDYKRCEITSSPSAMQQADDCLRLWWFRKEKRLPEFFRASSNLGDVAHEVFERWLGADDQGRDATGQPVNVFPDGWDERLSHAEAAILRAVFKKMVEDGVLRRTPGRVVERPFQVDLLPKEFSITGFIDLDIPHGAEDHKTSKAKKWLMTSEQIAADIQMLTYGCVKLLDILKSDAQGELPPHIALRQNQAVVDPESPHVMPSQFDAPPDYLLDFWEETLKPLARKMLELRRKKIPLEDWQKVPGPTKKGVCRKYGGCTFTGICSRTETPAQFKARMERAEAQPVEEPDMSSKLIDDLRKRKARASATKPADPPAEEVEAEAQSPPVDTESMPEVAPWANPNCRACGGDGINSNGRSCQPCSVLAAKKGVRSSDFDLMPGDGVIEIQREKLTVAVVPFAAEPTASDRTAPAKKEEPAAEEKPAPRASAKKASASKRASQAVDATKKRGRPRKGFTMLYGVVKRGKQNTLDLEQIFAEYAALMAEEMGAESYWALDPFKRRELLKEKAEVIAEKFGPATVQVTSTDRDILDFASALEVFAADVHMGGMIGG